VEATTSGGASAAQAQAEASPKARKFEPRRPQAKAGPGGAEAGPSLHLPESRHADAKASELKAESPQAKGPESTMAELKAPQAGSTEPKAPRPRATEPKASEPKAPRSRGHEPKAQQPPTQEPKASEPKAPQPKAHQPRVPEPKAPEPKAPKPKASEPKAPEPKAPEPKAPEPKAPEPKAPEPKAPEPKAPEAKAPEPKAAQPLIPERRNTAVLDGCTIVYQGSYPADWNDVLRVAASGQKGIATHCWVSAAEDQTLFSQAVHKYLSGPPVLVVPKPRSKMWEFLCVEALPGPARLPWCMVAAILEDWGYSHLGTFYVDHDTLKQNELAGLLRVGEDCVRLSSVDFDHWLGDYWHLAHRALRGCVAADGQAEAEDWGFRTQKKETAKVRPSPLVSDLQGLIASDEPPCKTRAAALDLWLSLEPEWAGLEKLGIDEFGSWGPDLLLSEDWRAALEFILGDSEDGASLVSPGSRRSVRTPMKSPRRSASPRKLAPAGVRRFIRRFPHRHINDDALKIFDSHLARADPWMACRATALEVWLAWEEVNAGSYEVQEEGFRRFGKWDASLLLGGHFRELQQYMLEYRDQILQPMIDEMAEETRFVGLDTSEPVVVVPCAPIAA